MSETADLRLIVDRGPKAIEIFTHLSAEQLLPTFGTDPEGLAAEDGRVYFGALRETGTFDFGDTIVEDVSFAVDGEPILLEAMSIMVHPLDNDLPFATPIDGAIAMSVCTVPDPEVPPAIGDLALFGGFIAYPETGYGEIAISLPNQMPLDLELVTFAGGKHVSDLQLKLPANGEIILPPASPPAEETWLGAMIGWLKGEA